MKVYLVLDLELKCSVKFFESKVSKKKQQKNQN
jgi:hypothetical protein